MNRHLLLTPTRFTMDEYLTFERAAEERHEYLDGVIYDMAGESPHHGFIAMNLGTALTVQLRGTGCRALRKDMKVQCGPHSPSSTKGLYAYPDMLVICGEMRFHDQVRDVLLNPVLIAEILSPSTASYDRGEKFLRYRRYLPSLTDYLLVSQDIPMLKHSRRTAPATWELHTLTGLDAVLTLPDLRVRLVLADLYDGVIFPSG